MPLDHYISQVYLKNFCPPEHENNLLTIRKTDLHKFMAHTKTVCRVDNGSTNPYLLDERAVEDFLKTIEPKYNKALNKVIDDNIDEECIYVIAGLIVYILTCSPAGMRLRSEPPRRLVETTAKMLDSKGMLPLSPPELGVKKITELLNEGSLKIEIDSKYPQAIGISMISDLIKAYVNSKWDILFNPFKNSPFFTSDYPIAIERVNKSYLINKIIPLSPWLAIKINPNIEYDEKSIKNIPFKNFEYRRQDLKHSEVIEINKLLVPCAEHLVFYHKELEWIPKFVADNANFRIETKSKLINNGNGNTLIHMSEEIVRIY